MRRFKREWREAAERCALACFNSPEYRYFHAPSESKEALAEAAMAEYRWKINSAHRQWLMHPKSKRYPQEMEIFVRELVRIGFYLLEQRDKKEKINEQYKRIDKAAE